MDLWDRRRRGRWGPIGAEVLPEAFHRLVVGNPGRGLGRLVLAAPQAGDGGQIVGAGGGHRPWRIFGRRPRLDQRTRKRQRPALGHPLPRLVFHGAEVLADREGPRPAALQGQECPSARLPR